MLLRPCVGLVCFCYVGVGVGLVCRSGLCRSGLFVCFCYGLVFFFYLCGSAESGGFVFLYQSSFCRVVFQKVFSKIQLFVRNKLLQENEHNNNSF